MLQPKNLRLLDGLSIALTRIFSRHKRSDAVMTTSLRPGHIFISYKREDAPIAERVYKALVEEGFNVWWDEHLQCGQSWAEKLDEAVRDAACIVVLWSQRSVASQWVRHEASQGIARQVYAPCRIELVQLDSLYDRIEATDLIKWDGDRGHGGFRNLIERINTLIPPQLSLPRGIGGWIGANLAMLAASGIALFALVLLAGITLEQRADRRENVYDCSAGRVLRAKLAMKMYSRDKDLNRVCLRNVDFINTNLSGAHLSGAHLIGANLTWTNFSKATLSFVRLDNTKNFQSAEVGGADYLFAELTGTFLDINQPPPDVLPAP